MTIFQIMQFNWIKTFEVLDHHLDVEMRKHFKYKIRFKHFIIIKHALLLAVHSTQSWQYKNV